MEEDGELTPDGGVGRQLAGGRYLKNGPIRICWNEPLSGSEL